MAKHYSQSHQRAFLGGTLLGSAGARRVGGMRVPQVRRSSKELESRTKERSHRSSLAPQNYPPGVGDTRPQPEGLVAPSLSPVTSISFNILNAIPSVLFPAVPPPSLCSLSAMLGFYGTSPIRDSHDPSSKNLHHKKTWLSHPPKPPKLIKRLSFLPDKTSLTPVLSKITPKHVEVLFHPPRNSRDVSSSPNSANDTYDQNLDDDARSWIDPEVWMRSPTDSPLLSDEATPPITTPSDCQHMDSPEYRARTSRIFTEGAKNAATLLRRMRVSAHCHSPLRKLELFDPAADLTLSSTGMACSSRTSDASRSLLSSSMLVPSLGWSKADRAEALLQDNVQRGRLIWPKA